MGLMDKLRGKSTAKNTPLKDFLDEDEDISTLFSINTKTITRSDAEKIAVINMGVNLIADSISEMPVYLYRRSPDGGRDKVDDNRNKLLNMNNGSYSNSFNMKSNLIRDYIYHGNGCLDIKRDFENNIESLIHIPYRDIQLFKSDDIDKRNTTYKYHYWGSEMPAYNVLNLVRHPKYDQMEGYGILDEGQLALASLLAIEEFMNGNAESGFNARGVVTKDTIMSQKSRESLRKHLKKFFSGSGAAKSGGVLILDDGMKLEQVDPSSQELQLLEQKDLLIKDVARLLNIPLPLIGIAASGMTYSNEQQLKLTLLKQTLSPIIRNLEETLNRYLLTEKEQDDGYFFEFQYQDLLKVSPEEELRVYGQAIKDGIMTVNEVRQKINLKPKPIEEGILKGGENGDDASRSEG